MGLGCQDSGGDTTNVNGREIPESLCWHVLDGLSKAMLWLQLGKRVENEHLTPTADVDWHPVLVTYMTPANGKTLNR